MDQPGFRAVCVLVFVLASFLPATSAQENLAPKNVLVLNSWGNDSLEPLKATVRSRLSMPVNFYVEYLDLARSVDPAYRESLSETLYHVYSAQKFDLVVVSGYPALRFALDYRDRTFPRIPIMFLIVDRSRLEGLNISAGVTGLEISTDVRGSLDLALRLHPEAQRIVLIAGVSETETYWNQRFREEMRLHFGSLKLIELIGLPPRAILDRIATFPEHTILFAQIQAQDSADPHVFDLLKQVGQRFPTYTFFDRDYCLGHGCVGGSSIDEEEYGRQAGRIAARILSGESPESIPVEVGSAARPFVDWRELRHWGIPESALPAGTLVFNREPTLWRRGRKYFILGSLIILLQTLLILGLLWQRRRKLTAESDLRASEERFSKCFRESPLAITITKISDSRFVEVNEAFERQLGWSRDEIISRRALDFDLWVDARQGVAFREQLLTNGRVRELEVGLRRKDGQTLTTLVSAETIELGGSTCAVSIAADISERKRAEEVLSTVSRRLIEAQEKERRWIARELHDDVNQRIALLSITLAALKKECRSSNHNMTLRFEETMGELKNLGKDVQALSHHLHSSKLEYLGLTAACRGFCGELSEQHGVAIEFRSDEIPRNLSKDVSLCLFRVLQEALQNAVKYSGVREFRASLNVTSDRLSLTVQDSGCGFDLQEKMSGRGLGLTSMRERIKLADGELSIESKPGEGTTICARAPLTTIAAETTEKPRAAKAAPNTSF